MNSEQQLLWPTLASSQRAAKSSVKRCVDVVGTLLLLLMLLPILVTIAVLVRVSSAGPILFRQQRAGKDGAIFEMYKFRTMFSNSDPAIHQAYSRDVINGEAKRIDGAFKLTRDPRVTPIGRFLRRSSLDELPQLLNVLKGEMSLVGPRPPILYEVELYTPRDYRRLCVTPGMTGLWQVSGRSELSFQQMIDLDLAYIESWSIWTDLQILLKTPVVVVTGRGAH